MYVIYRKKTNRYIKQSVDWTPKGENSIHKVSVPLQSQSTSTYKNEIKTIDPQINSDLAVRSSKQSLKGWRGEQGSIGEGENARAAHGGEVGRLPPQHEARARGQGTQFSPCFWIPPVSLTLFPTLFSHPLLCATVPRHSMEETPLQPFCMEGCCFRWIISRARLFRPSRLRWYRLLLGIKYNNNWFSMQKMKEKKERTYQCL